MRGLVLGLVLVGTVLAIEENGSNGFVENWKRESLLEHYKVGYTDGYEEGLRRGIEEGYRIALEDFRKVYQEKLREYEEIEAGKLLIKESRISYPRVYMAGSGKLVVAGCEIVRPVDDLLHKVPMREVPREEREDISIRNVPVRPYFTTVWCGDEGRLRGFSPVYYRKEGSGCYKVYFEERRGVEELCKLGRCR